MFKKSNLRISYFLFIFFLSSSCSNRSVARKEIKMSNSDSEFVYFFKILDSAANQNTSDTIDCCTGAISFMEAKTKIPASALGGFVGKLYYTKTDLKRWHEWYIENKNKLK